MLASLLTHLSDRAHRPRRASATRGLLLGLALSLAFTACLEPPPERDVEDTVQVFSWWTSKSEAAALDALLKVHQKRYPAVRVTNAAESLAEKARDRLADRMSSGLPPDTFQANIGVDLLRWVVFNEVDARQSKVEALDDLADENGWMTEFPPQVLEALSYEDHLYGVPVNIHRINTLFYDTQLLDSLDLKPPRDLAEFHAVLDALVEEGYTHPLSIGSKADWTLSLLAMENLFPAVVGATYYSEYWRGEHEAESPEMKQTLDELLKLWPYFNENANDMDWTAGVDSLLENPTDKRNKAVFTVMGDWAKGHLMASGFTPGKDFGQVPFPGTRGTFVFTADCFPLPKGAPNREDARHLLETFGSRRGQLAFNALKGSIPVRKDIDPDELDPSAALTWNDFRTDQGVTALSGLLDDAFANALAQAVKDTLTDNDPDPVLFALRNHYGN
jgi:glucose/mannose transport system substrate-binding protein